MGKALSSAMCWEIAATFWDAGNDWRARLTISCANSLEAPGIWKENLIFKV